jgi:hypothetical protein
MDPETLATETPATETATEPQSFDDRLLAFIQGGQQEADGAATDGATVDADESETGDTPVADTPKETPATEPKTDPFAAAPFTDEELEDDAFFDKLDAAGWDKLRVYSPALFKMGKQVASLRGKAGAALKGKPEPTETRSEATPPKVSAEMRAALLKQQSLDEDEALEGAAEVARLTLREERAREREQQNAEQQDAQAVYNDAYEVAAKELPALADIPDEELDKAVESSPRLMRKLTAATSHPNREQRVLLVADVMEEAGRSVVAKRQSAEKAEVEAKAAQKKAADQERLRSNESNPSRHLVDTPGGAVTRTTRKSFETDGLAFIQSQISANKAGS